MSTDNHVSTLEKFLGTGNGQQTVPTMASNENMALLKLIDERVNLNVSLALGQVAPQINAAFEGVFGRLAVLESKAGNQAATNIVDVAMRAIQNAAPDAPEESPERRVYDKAFLVLEGILNAALSSVAPGPGDPGEALGEPAVPEEVAPAETADDQPGDEGDSQAPGSPGAGKHR